MRHYAGFGKSSHKCYETLNIGFTSIMNDNPCEITMKTSYSMIFKKHMLSYVGVNNNQLALNGYGKSKRT